MSNQNDTLINLLEDAIEQVDRCYREALSQDYTQFASNLNTADDILFDIKTQLEVRQ